MLETISGKTLDINNLKVKDIDIHDIAWSLSRIPRYVGHTIDDIPYNVAEHSIFVTKLYLHYIAQDDIGLLINNIMYDGNTIIELGIPDNINVKYFLLHDAHEYIMSDIPTHVKRINQDIYKAIKEAEKKIDKVIYEYANIIYNEDIHKYTKIFDDVAFKIESFYYLHSRGKNFNKVVINDFILLNYLKKPMPSNEAYHTYIKMYNELKG